MPDLGVMALEEGPRVDFDRLRGERRARCLAAMAEHDLDVLVLGREANARYVSGARRLWTAGTRPFAPACVLVRESAAVFLMSTWDDGVPADVPREHLYSLTWNPMKLIEALGRAGVAGARRAGVDAMNPLFRQLLPAAMPAAEVVDASGLLRTVRMRKTADEIACLRTAVAIAEAAMTAAVAALRPGARERDLQGAFVHRMTDFGVTAPATEGTFSVIDPTADGAPAVLRRLTGDGTVDDGDLVAMSAGALYAGYEGSLGRTWACGSGRPRPEHRELHRRWQAVWDRLADACRPGATGADLAAAHQAAGEPLPPLPVAYSVGIGYEAPIAGTGLGAEFERGWRLESGMVLGLQGWVAGPAGGYLGLEMVLVTDDGHEVLTTLGHGPLSQA